MPAMTFDTDDTHRLRAHYADEIAGLKRRAARRQRARRAVGVVLSAGLLVAGAVFAVGWHDIAAPAKAPRSVTLTDGNRVDLDAGAVIEVPWAPWRHRVRLSQGIALFDIDHDENRHFVVEIAGSELIDRGTRFLVERQGDAATVAVFDGEVEIVTASGRRDTVTRGQARRAAADTVTSLPMPDETEAASWRDGRLVFRATPLAEVAARLSRYGDRPVVVGAAALAPLRVSGSFLITDDDGALATLERALPLRARRDADRIVLVPASR